MRILILVLLAWAEIVMGRTFSINGSSARSPYITLSYQNISICPEKVKVVSEYTNHANHSITETFVFTSPLNLKVATQPVQLQLVQYAFSHEGLDISAHLNLLGLPFDPIAAMHTIDASNNRDNIISKLLALRLIDPKESMPNWTLKAYYYWQYTFQAYDKVIIEQSYKPNLAIKNVKLNNITTLLKAPIIVIKKAVNFAIHWNMIDNAAAANLQAQLQKYISNIDTTYCPSKNDYKAIALSHRLNMNRKSILETKALTFTYNSDDLWYRPLNRFILTINTTENMYPVLCWHDKLQREANNSLRFSAENYMPMQDINVLYIEK